MTEREREIAEMLQAVPLTDLCSDRIGRPDYDAMARAVAEREHQGCPCLHVEPCDPRCTCRNRFSSYGCTRCCSYGSAEQQRATARELADRDARLARVVEAARALDTWMRWKRRSTRSVLKIAQIHSAPYVGPKWTEERRALKAALADAGAGKKESNET